MAGDIAVLKTTLADMISAFNAQNMGLIRPHLANDLTVTALRDRPSFHGSDLSKKVKYTGARAVQALSAQFLDHANFMKNGEPAFDPPSGVVNKATIKGTATWKDDHGKDQIQFVFECVFDDSKSSWLFRTVSAFTV